MSDRDWTWTVLAGRLVTLCVDFGWLSLTAMLMERDLKQDMPKPALPTAIALQAERAVKSKELQGA